MYQIYTCIEFDKTSFSQTMKNANWGIIRNAWPEYSISRFLQKKIFALVIFWAFTLLLTDNTRFSLALHYEFLGIWKLSRKKKKPKSDEHENNQTFGIITLWHSNEFNVGTCTFNNKMYLCLKFDENVCLTSLKLSSTNLRGLDGCGYF